MQERVPVAITVMGGAWVIGYRVWSTLFAYRLAAAGTLVVAVDYRNYPCVDMAEMVDDVQRAIGWVLENIEHYGGDPNNVVLIGQSAGAHLGAMALIQQAQAEIAARAVARTDSFCDTALDIADSSDSDDNEAEVLPRVGSGVSSVDSGEWEPRSPRLWSPLQLRGFVGVSGVYDLPELKIHMESRKIFPLLDRLCKDGALTMYSPVQRITELQAAGVAQGLPPIHLFHGEADRTAPVSGSKRFGKVLREAGALAVSMEVRAGMGHTEPVVEDPLVGGDMQVGLILPLLLGEEESQRRMAALPPCRARAPAAWVWTVSPMMPF